MKAIFISLVYEILIWIAYLLTPHSFWDWDKNYVQYIMYSLVAAAIQIVVYFLSAKILPMREESSYKKHFCSFVISHIVFTLIIWLIISRDFHKECLRSALNFDADINLMIRIIVFLGGEQGICVLVFSDMIMKISVFVGFLLNMIFRKSEKYE